MIVTPATFTPKNPRGFIVLDGVNGAGKGTLQRKIIEHCQKLNKQVVATREPGGTALGKELRSLLLEAKSEPAAPLAEVFLFAADRAQHVERLIEPAITQKKLVIGDRYYYSTLAFQGYGRGLDLPTLTSINQIAINKCLPDFVILLDLDPEEGLRRTKKRTTEGGDTFEQEALDFHRRLRKGFLEIAKTFQEPFVVIDASKTPDQVFAEVEPLLQRWITSLS